MAEILTIEDQAPREKCGIVGIYAPGQDPARLAFFALYALQHRGQESAGITTADGDGLKTLTGMGLVNQVFHERELARLTGDFAVGHTRYSTTGASKSDNAQPIVVRGEGLDEAGEPIGSLAIGHNGNIVNLESLQQQVAKLGVTPKTSNDTGLVAHLIAHAPGNDWPERIKSVLPGLQGAYCFVILTKDRLFAARDPWGIRPLSLGRLPNGGWIVASETCALDTIGATFIREVERGEFLTIDANGVHTEQLGRMRKASCSFEHIYFARPDSLIDERLVYETRERFGEELAREHPVEADLVMPVPDSATPAAIGFARASGIPYREGLVKNRYIGRTFIQPHQSQREQGVEIKFNPLREVLRGQRVVLVDDSIVRGTTTPRIVNMLRRAGAKEVHLRISSPPIKYACYLGVDTAPEEKLVANQLSVPEIEKMTGADSLGYLSLEGLVRSIGLPNQDLCNACFHGNYPMPIEGFMHKESMETPADVPIPAPAG